MSEKRRDPKKEASWRRQIRRQARSGVTVRAWCLAHQVSEATFHWWRRELARRDAEQTPAAGRGWQEGRRHRREHRKTATTLQPVPRVALSPAFVPVRVGPTDSRVRPTDPRANSNVPHAIGSHIEIALPDGRCIRVIGQVDRQMLADVLSALEPSAC